AAPRAGVHVAQQSAPFRPVAGIHSDQHLCGLSMLASRAIPFTRVQTTIRKDVANETSPPKFPTPGSGCCRAAGGLAHRFGAGLSDADSTVVIFLLHRQRL